MSKKFSTDSFIKEKVDVAEANTTRVFGKSAPRQHIQGSSARIILTGLPGSGRGKLADLLAEKHNLRLIAPESVTSFEELNDLCNEDGYVLVLPHKAFDVPEIVQELKTQGSVFYLMTEVMLMAQRLGCIDDEAKRDAISAELVQYEPIFMTTLNFISQGWQEPEALVTSIEESLGISA